MTNPTQWAWDVPLPREAATTRVVLLALAEFSAPILPGTTTVRLGVVDPTHPAISETANMNPEQVARHIAALVRADVLIPAPSGPLVRFNEDVTAASTRVAKVVADMLDVLPDSVPAVVTPIPTRTAQTPDADQTPLIEVDAPTAAAPAKKAAKSKQETPEQTATKDVLAWWWDYWTAEVGPVANGAAFSAHAKRVAATMLAEGHSIEAIKDAFKAVDQPRPAEFAVRNHLRGKGRTGAAVRGSAANRDASQPRQANNPFAGLAGVSR